MCLHTKYSIHPQHALARFTQDQSQNATDDIADGLVTRQIVFADERDPFWLLGNSLPVRRANTSCQTQKSPQK